MIEKKGAPMEEKQESIQPEAESSQEVTAETTLLTKPSLLKRSALWFLAVLLAASAMIYQRATGPTYPVKIRVAEGITAKLIRTHESTADAIVELPAPLTGESKPSATLFYKRYRTADEFTSIPMKAVEAETQYKLEAALPKQPAAGKLEYYIEAKIEGKERRFPEKPETNVLIRFKDPVPDAILYPHVTLMIFSILFGMRSGLAALFAPYNMRQLAWLTLCGMTIGGMILGPCVQKYAFGEYWTGFPLGGDWTDNKMLFMFLAWVFACSIIGLKPRKKEHVVSRVVVFLAAIVMTVCYLIPHSMGGSELDYSQVDQGIDPSEAIKTGRQ
ncbi:hypothetical protein [uncultured Gimesia sp.]|uniref:hypothetical protein n=1 Tax=uncultured Gimesia sp. TaxID=1678688 RepID=UPI00260494FF|nr:hypothetical protein [uncultured Gimesia sp.]